MNHNLANRIYLIIIVVCAITIGFITGYIVGIKHSVPAMSEQNKAQTVQELQADRVSTQDIKIQNQEEPAKSAEPVRTDSDRPLEKPKEDIKSDLKAQDTNIQVKETKENQKAVAETVKQETKSFQQPRDVKGIYTVQAGAFKNEKEALALKTKLEKKGYNNIYILKERKSKNGVLFKIRVGDFETKKEAEIFAVKLNKTEGFRAFAVKK